MSTVKANIKYCQAEDLRRLRENYPALQKYLDGEIAACLETYGAFHIEEGEAINDAHFIKWATNSPLDNEVDVSKNSLEKGRCDSCGADDKPLFEVVHDYSICPDCKITWESDIGILHAQSELER